jgi:hypothetical protein
MRNILFHSDSKYLSLIQKDECKFYTLLEKKLLKKDEGDLNLLEILIKNKDGTQKSGIISSEQFFDELYKKRCINNKEFKVLFNEKNFAKTISGIKFTVPRGETECKIIHNDWLNNSYTPYLCAINSTLKYAQKINKEKMTNEEAGTIKASDIYIQKTTLLQRNYLESLCNNLNSAKNFCGNYLKDDIWSKVINGEAPAYKLNYKCQNLLDLPLQLSLADQKKCVKKFLNEPKSCYTIGNKNFPSFYPLQNCDTISLALNHSKLITNYHDCPGNIDNEAITNVHRILNHFVPRKINSSSEICSGEANYSFAKLNLDLKYEKGWPLKVCYFNRIENKEICTIYIPGSREEEILSEDQVISKILYLHKGAPAKTKCRIVTSKQYNPIRSEFKNGCFIVYNSETCTTLSCEKKVIWDEKVQEDIKFVGSPIFEYYPSSFANERYSIQSMLNEVKGIQSRILKNINDLKFYLDKINSSIVHGVGCREDLLPEFYIRNLINECHPLPFIIDGYTIINGETYLTTRTAIDDLFSPRLIHWSNIYNSVSAYKEIHPLNSWTLHGLKK